MYNPVQINALNEITMAAQRVRRELDNIRSLVTGAIARMEAGNNPSQGWGSPIGHQAPADLERYTERLECKQHAALALRISLEHIQKAYELGVCDLMSPRFEELQKEIRSLAD